MGQYSPLLHYLTSKEECENVLYKKPQNLFTWDVNKKLSTYKHIFGVHIFPTLKKLFFLDLSTRYVKTLVVQG